MLFLRNLKPIVNERVTKIQNGEMTNYFLFIFDKKGLIFSRYLFLLSSLARHSVVGHLPYLNNLGLFQRSSTDLHIEEKRNRLHESGTKWISLEVKSLDSFQAESLIDLRAPIDAMNMLQLWEVGSDDARQFISGKLFLEYSLQETDWQDFGLS